LSAFCELNTYKLNKFLNFKRKRPFLHVKIILFNKIV